MDFCFLCGRSFRSNNISPFFFLEDTMREIRVGWQTQLFPRKFVAEKNSELNNVHTSLNIVAFFFSLK